MSSDINKCVFTGRLTRDAEQKALPNGTDVLKFSLAVNDRRNVGGEWTDAANFLDFVMFGNRARAIADYMAKGTQVAVEAKARWSSWEKDGRKQSKVEFVADDVVLLSRKAEAKTEQAEPVYDEAIPF